MHKRQMPINNKTVLKCQQVEQYKTKVVTSLSFGDETQPSNW